MVPMMSTSQFPEPGNLSYLACQMGHCPLVLFGILRWDGPGLRPVCHRNCPHKKEAEGGLEAKRQGEGGRSGAGMFIGQRTRAASGS